MATRTRKPRGGYSDPIFAAELAAMEQPRLDAEAADREAFARDWAERLKRPTPPPAPPSVRHHHIDDCWDGPVGNRIISVPGGGTASARGRICTHTHVFVEAE